MSSTLLCVFIASYSVSRDPPGISAGKDKGKGKGKWQEDLPTGESRLTPGAKGGAPRGAPV